MMLLPPNAAPDSAETRAVLRAVHEAGHAVVAYLGGLHVTSVRGGLDPVCKTPHPIPEYLIRDRNGVRRVRPTPRSLRLILGRAAADLAGGAAEQRLVRGRGWTWLGPSLLPGGAADEMNCRTWLRGTLLFDYATGKVAATARAREGLLLRGLLRRVRRTMEDESTWRAVEAVAAHLLEHGEASGEEAFRLIATAFADQVESQ